ncbi:hypothetical protein ACVW0I_008266 [Bradyrhizobium sp. LM6.11]
MRVGFRELGRKLREPAGGRNGVRRGVIAYRAIDDDQGVQGRVLAGLGVETCTELGIRHRDSRAGIGEIELQQIRRRQRVDQQRHEAGAHGTEERGGIGRSVIEEQQHAIAALEAQRGKAVAPAASLRCRVRHKCACPRDR